MAAKVVLAGTVPVTSLDADLGERGAVVDVISSRDATGRRLLRHVELIVREDGGGVMLRLDPVAAARLAGLLADAAEDEGEPS